MSLAETQVSMMRGAGAEEAPALVFEDVSFSYEAAGPVLSSVNLALQCGEVTALVGRNGSGKSTLARLANGILLPSAGRVLAAGLSTADRESVWLIRSKVALVMQDPEQQIVGATVEEETAFGLENLGVVREEMRMRVGEVLARLNLADEATTEVHQLSGGQKQRLALAGVLVLRPQVLVLDEPTSMLDLRGRMELARMVREEAARGVAVMLITQRAEEAAAADRVVVLAEGRIAYDGEPRGLFPSSVASRLGLSLPPVLKLAAQLPLGQREVGRHTMEETGSVGAEAPTPEALPRTKDALLTALEKMRAERRVDGPVPRRGGRRRPPAAPAARLTGVSLSYAVGAGEVRQALSQLDLEVPAGAVTALLGATASGKSSLLHVLGGVRQAGEGTVEVLGRVVARSGDFPRSLVGLALQRPESALFAATVEEDVAAAPRYRGLEGRALQERVSGALAAVGLDDSFRERSPFALSVGEQRRVALAGVLSLAPQLLLLDEPAAGLDPAGRARLLSRLVPRRPRPGSGRVRTGAAASRMLTSSVHTVVFSTHDTEEAAAYADYVAVIAHGRVAEFGRTGRVLADVGLLEAHGLEAPLAASLGARLGAEPADRVFDPTSLVRFISGSGQR